MEVHRDVAKNLMSQREGQPFGTSNFRKRSGGESEDSMGRRAVWTAMFGCLTVTVLTFTWQPVWAEPAAGEAPATARSESRLGGQVANESVAELVSDGIRLERGRKWLEAIEFYEKAVKSHPNTPELEYGLRRSKIYFGIDRRYTDKSFRGQLLGVARSESMALFEEVISSVQAKYVDPISVTSLLAHGTESLYLALNDDRFREANVPHHLRGRIKGFRDRLREEYWNRPLPTREAGRQMVNQICDAAERELSVPGSAIVLEYIFGACNALDDYSGYLTPSRLNDLYGNIEGEFVGLGIEMRAETGRGMLLVHVIPGGPAEQGGLQPGEHIAAIDGRDCRNMTTDEAAGYLQGQEGSRVTLEVTGEAGSRNLALVRRPVVVKSVSVVKMIGEGQDIGYIKLTSFQKSTVEEFDAAVQQLRQQGMRALIWDLRGNPGGLLSTSVELLDRFIADGVLVSTKGRTADQNWSYTAHRQGTLNIPLVLLIDGDSASASEIVAGAVRDHQRGTIVGRKSYGKWSVQSIFPGSSGTGLRLTTAKFYSPNGHTLGKIGVKPDVEVPAPVAEDKPRFRKPVDLASDPDVMKALEVISEQFAAR